jgi:hypothetical protein
VKAMGVPSYMRTAMIPFPEASHSNMNVFVRYGRDRIGVEHIISLKSCKERSTTEFQVKALFLRREVRGVAIFP